ncbi:membrane protein [Bordetella pertussis]|nr:membrane protein [Bordetella pertussis]
MHPWPDASEPGLDPREQPGVIQNAQIATLANRVQAYNAQPRKEFVAPAAQASRHAAYLDRCAPTAAWPISRSTSPRRTPC